MIHITIAKVSKAGFDGTIDIDWDALPDNVKTHIIEYGLRQSLNDRVAGEKVTDEESADNAMALVVKRVDGWHEGIVRTHTGGTVDPVATEARRIAETAVKAAIKAKGGKIADYAKQMPRLAAAYLEKYPETVDTARENVERAKAATESVDLDDLLDD